MHDGISRYFGVADTKATSILTCKRFLAPFAFVVDVPDVFTQAFVIEKDSKRFPKPDGWGLRAVQL